MSDLPGVGVVVGAADVVAGAQRTLAAWLPPYVAALQLAMPDLGIVPPVLIDRVPLAGVMSQADQVPAVFCSSPGTTGAYVRSGTGSWGAWYLLHVVVVDRDDDWAQTADRIGRWASLITAVLLAHPDLDGVAGQLEPVEEASGQLAGDSRTLAGARCSFRAFVPVIAQQGPAGPLQPEPDPGQPPAGSPLITAAELTISRGIPT